MNIVPKRNLSDQAEPWGRSVDQRLSDLERSSGKDQQDTANALSGLNSTTTKLSKQVLVIDELTQKLAEQQEQLAQQIEAIEAVINAQLAPVSDQVSNINFNVNPGPNTPILSTTISVPSGYSRALVYATSTLSAYNNTATDDTLYITTRINGAVVGWANSTSVNSAKFGSVSMSSTALLTSLGSTFGVTSAASTDNVVFSAADYNTTNLSVMVIFLR